MKTKNIIMVTVIVALALIAFTYFKKAATSKTAKSPNPSMLATIVSARYIGPDRMYTGATLKAGDSITGTVNEDGSLNYTMWGNGIVASKTVIVIPENQYVMTIE